MFKWLGRNIGYILNPALLITNPPNKVKNKLESQAKKNLENYIAENGKPPPTGTLLSMQGTQQVGSVLNFGGFASSMDANNPLKGQTGTVAFATNLDRSKQNMNVVSQLPPVKADKIKLDDKTPEVELTVVDKPSDKPKDSESEILSAINPDIKVSATGNSNNSLAIAAIALLGLFFIAK